MRYVLFGEGALNARSLQWLRERGDAPVAHFTDRLSHPEDTARLAALQVDFGLSIGYRHKLAPELIAACGQGILNLHWGYLPYGRGADPQVWAILDNEPAGVTLHWMDAGIDTGPIVGQWDYPVTFGDTAATLYHKLQQLAFEEFTHLWDWVDRKAEPWPSAYIQTGNCSTHRRADLHALDQRPIDIATVNLLRAKTFPGYPGYRYRHTDGHLYDLTINIKRVPE